LEWIIANFGGSDEVDRFVRAKLKGVCSRVVYVRVEGLAAWHASIAKNIAHRLGSGEVLFNLDCDNLIGEDAVVALNLFTRGVRILHVWSGVHRDGTFGRIAFRRDVFERLGGYDETFYPMAYQDRDILERGSHSGIPVVEIRSPSSAAVTNTKQVSIRHCRRGSMSWADYDRLNRAASRSNILAGRLRANSGIAPRSFPCRFFWGHFKASLMPSAKTKLYRSPEFVQPPLETALR
jgi:hypothetical protein